MTLKSSPTVVTEMRREPGGGIHLGGFKMLECPTSQSGGGSGQCIPNEKLILLRTLVLRCLIYASKQQQLEEDG